jgi:hypothetical protein
MLSEIEFGVIEFYVEAFFFGKISVLCAKEVHLFLGDLGIYTGIFALYLQCPSKESRMANIVFFVLCLLYVLSIATVVSDLLETILEVSNNSTICKIIIMTMRIASAST